MSQNVLVHATSQPSGLHHDGCICTMRFNWCSKIPRSMHNFGSKALTIIDARAHVMIIWNYNAIAGKKGLRIRSLSCWRSATSSGAWSHTGTFVSCHDRYTKEKFARLLDFHRFLANVIFLHDIVNGHPSLVMEFRSAILFTSFQSYFKDTLISLGHRDTSKRLIRYLVHCLFGQAKETLLKDSLVFSWTYVDSLLLCGKETG